MLVKPIRPVLITHLRSPLSALDMVVIELEVQFIVGLISSMNLQVHTGCHTPEGEVASGGGGGGGASWGTVA